ncbi:RNA polymerase sigma factor SigJ [Yinghuangia soli]|uniref:RNA polymerase sigma factor SigJ n=1 Tax=Yinghuangia soli TaxID=2908204 RepID=A0AA41Q3T9_9ACTN|nr:RNA polymerase sigma factor SigJ [Yinghuangia soli]MCF2530816.1 RNA polymerase sigma factor SigJ [Yinghuangia soli]
MSADADAQELLAVRFEEHRSHLRAVGYRMLGSVAEAEDAVQETWIRLSRSDVSGVENLGGWLTTVAGRVCLDMLRSRSSRREDAMETYVPDPLVSVDDAAHPEYEAELADSVGLALLVVLETLPPAERLAFVLHDMFAVPFEDIAPIVDRSPATARQLASRGRRKVQGRTLEHETDRSRQREVVGAFLAAARGGDFEALLTVLDPDVVMRADTGGVGGASRLVLGARAVAQQAEAFRSMAPFARMALVNGMPGVVTAPDGKAFSVMAFTVVDGLIVEINLLADPARLGALDIPVVSD